MPYSGRRLGHALEALELLERLLLGLLRHAGLLDLLPKLGELGRFFVALAELLLNLPELLAQDVLALLRGQRLLRLLADLLGELENLDALDQHASTLSRRCLTSIVSSRSCFSAGLASMMPATKSASADGGFQASIAVASSGGAAGRSSIASRARARISSTRAVMSGVSTSETPISSTFATRNG